MLRMPSWRGEDDAEPIWRNLRAARTPYPRQNSTVPCFLVDDFDAAYRALEARGVAFYLVGEQEWGWYAHFRDPEGNELQIYQPKPGYREVRFGIRT